MSSRRGRRSSTWADQGKSSATVTPAPENDKSPSGFASPITFTTVNIRKGASCPGLELIDSCAVGFYVDNAFLDYPVDVGTYWIIIDGYSLASGSYRLDVRVAPPAPPL